jgi:hypothetical protein
MKAPLFAAMAAAALSTVVATHGSAGAAQVAEPAAFQVLTSAASPRVGRSFVGVAIATLEEGARLYRAVESGCKAGRIRVRSGKTLLVPVVLGRLPRNPQEGGGVRAVVTCSWRVPDEVRGRSLVSYVVTRLVNPDGTSSQESQTVEWVIR